MNSQGWVVLCLFVALLLAVSLQGLAASGHFPKAHRAPDLCSKGGAAILHGSMLVSAASLLIGIVSIWGLVPWYAGVIGAGLVLLGAPLMLRLFSDAVVNGRALLVGLAAASGLLALLLVALT
jgi:hypothetical protein